MATQAKDSQFSDFQNSASSTSPPLTGHYYIQKISWKIFSRPIRRAESSGILHFAIAQLVVASQAKTSPNFPIFKIPPNNLHHLFTGHEYCQKFVEGYSWTLLMRLFRRYHPFFRSTAGCGFANKNVSDFQSRPNIHPDKTHHKLQSENRGRLFLDLLDVLNPAVPFVCQ